MHDLNLAAFLHDIGLLMLPHDLTLGVNTLDPESYVAVQNHLGLAPRFSNRSSFSERLPSSWPTSTNDGTDRAILTASGDDSFPLEPGSSRLPLLSMQSTSPKSRTESQPAPNLTRS